MTLIRRAGTRGTTWSFRFFHAGRLYKRAGYPTRGVAEAAEAERRREVAQADTPGAIVTPWTEAVERYTAAKAGKVDLHEHDLPHLAWWGLFLAAHGITTLQAIVPEALDQAKTALTTAGKRGSTQQRYFAVLRHLCQLACRRWTVGTPPRPLLAFNPVFAVDWPRARPATTRVPTLAHVRRLIAAAEPFLRPVILLAVYTGFRAGSLLRLEAGDLQARPGCLRSIQKGDRVVFLPIDRIPELGRALRKLVKTANGGRLLRWPDGRPMTRFPRKAWVRALRTAGLLIDGRPAFRFHALRHCCGTLLAEAGVPERIIQEWMGHETARMTRDYTRSVRLRPAAAALGRRRLM
jgi:integrase